MQPQAPANPAETFAKMPRMEAMEHTTMLPGVYFGGQEGGRTAGRLGSTVAVVQQPRRSTHIGLRTYSTAPALSVAYGDRLLFLFLISPSRTIPVGLAGCIAPTGLFSLGIRLITSQAQRLQDETFEKLPCSHSCSLHQGG